MTGGNVADAVVRIGATVRKPATAASPAVRALLVHLSAAGFAGAPRALGSDESGRQVLEYVPGSIAEAMPAMDLAELRRLGRLIRRLHEAAASFRPPEGARWDVVVPPDRQELVCHNDLAPWNLVRDGRRWVFIDWDGAGPGSRLWDLGYAAQGFVPLRAGGDPAVDARRLRALVDGYGLDPGERRRLPAAMGGHTRGMAEVLERGARTGRQPWARLHAEGHGAVWAGAADYIDAHRGVWAAAVG
ncbi:MAG: phosphotransferase [Dactylosporangium sp.]|nr:phosphotransferase [Dactylosporangium sp.]